MVRKRRTKQQVKAIFNNSPYKNIKTKEDLIAYLSVNPNRYTDFMLKLIYRDNILSVDERHHIIPTSEGGPNESWNLIPVSYEEHRLAHQLRYEVYGKEGDRLASMGRENLSENAKAIKTARAKLGHQTMKERGIGFYNSALQSELGKRSGGRKTPAREIGYTKLVNNSKKEFFTNALIFNHKELDITSETKPNQFVRTGQIKDYLLSIMPKSSIHYNLILNDKYFSTNINKVLNKIINNEIVGNNYYKGWSVKIK